MVRINPDERNFKLFVTNLFHDFTIKSTRYFFSGKCIHFKYKSLGFCPRTKEIHADSESTILVVNYSTKTYYIDCDHVECETEKLRRMWCPQADEKYIPVEFWNCLDSNVARIEYSIRQQNHASL